MPSPTEFSRIQSPSAPLAPSFSTLPLELKILIVEKVAEGRSNVWTDPTPWSRSTTTMRSVVLVSRELAALMQPFLWQVVIFNRYTIQLVYFVESILPRHANHMRLLGIWQSDDAKSIDDGRYHLVSRAIASMPAVTTVFYLLDHLLHGRLPTRRFVNFPAGSHPEDPVALALMALGDRLKGLTLQGIGDIELDGGGISTFLSHFPSLSRLSVICPTNYAPTLQAPSASTFASLCLLRCLSLRLRRFDSETFANAAWECPLETLELDVDSSFSLQSLTTLLTHFSSTLTTLTLHANSDDRMDPSPPTLSTTPAPLPCLRTLTLKINHPSSFLASFSFCPLQYLTILSCPRTSCTAWCAFVTSHAATLHRVIVQSVQGINSLQVLCETHGIEYRPTR